MPQPGPCAGRPRSIAGCACGRTTAGSAGRHPPPHDGTLLSNAWRQREAKAKLRDAERSAGLDTGTPGNRRPAPSCAQAQLHAAAPVLQLATDDDPLGASAEGLSGPRGRASQSGEYQIVRPFAVFSRFFVRVSGTVLECVPPAVSSTRSVLPRVSESGAGASQCWGARRRRHRAERFVRG